MKEDYTHIAIVLDRSGSMSTMWSDVEGGFNSLVEDQKKEKGKATLTLAAFDNVYEVIYDFEDLENVDGVKVHPRNMTALLDAMGTTLNSTKETIDKLDEKPEKVLFVFMTDGLENSSREFSKERVFEMIEELKGEEIDYDFTFIGANQDAISAGGGYGIRKDASMTYAASGAGATYALDSLSKGITRFRSAKKVGGVKTKMSYVDEDYAAQDSLLDTDK